MAADASGAHPSITLNDVGTPKRIITAAEMDGMTPQERADAIDAGIVRSWDDVDPEFRERVTARAEEVRSRHHTDG